MISLLAGVLGFGGMSQAAAGAARIVFFIAIAIFLLFVILVVAGTNLTA